MTQSAPPKGPLAKSVDIEVRRQLGREPLSKLEAAQVRKRIYDGHPGLLSAVRDEERALAGEAPSIEKRVGLAPTLSEMLATVAARAEEMSDADRQELILELQRRFGIGKSSLRQLVSKKVTEILGRTPMSKLESARTKQEIYRANPGLLTAIVKAEREARGQEDEIAAAIKLLEKATARDEAAQDHGKVHLTKETVASLEAWAEDYAAKLRKQLGMED